MPNIVNRKKFLIDSAASVAGIMIGSNLLGCSGEKKAMNVAYPVMPEVLKYRKFDAHSHVGLRPKHVEEILDFADRLGIEKMCISSPVANYSGNEPEGPEEIRKANNSVIDAVKRYPDRFIGYLTLNPRYQKESMEEINRCVDQGLKGYKGYTQVKINDPLYFPLIERFIDLKMLIFMHAFCQIGMGGYRMKYDVGMVPNTSIPEDFVDIAKRYPEGTFQFAHIGGGGDWEYECKMLKDSPNVYVDTSGSNNEENMIDFAVKYLGEDRLFFGTDSSYYQAVGKILASNLNESQKKKIFFENYQNVLKKLGKDVG